MIAYSGDASDPTDGTLPASAFTWTIDFLHDGHVHPGTPQVGSKSGTFTIPTSGHDFSGNTRYRITLTVTDSSGLTDTRSVTIYPQKVALSFATVPVGLTLYLDGIARVTPFVHDALIGFNYTINAPSQVVGPLGYTFALWSDGGSQQHTIVAPAIPAAYIATFTPSLTPATPTFVQVNAAVPPQPQSTVTVAFTAAQSAGNLNVLAIGWNDATSNITSVTDSAGNAYQVAAPTARGTGLSQAIYYAKNIVSASAGSNVVTVTFNTAVPWADIRILEYSGLDAVNPFDKTAAGTGTATLASSPVVTTTAPAELVFGAGMTARSFKSAGAGFTKRIITSPDADIAEDRNVTTIGSYNATATQNTTGAWLMQVATFKAAGQ